MTVNGGDVIYAADFNEAANRRVGTTEGTTAPGITTSGSTEVAVDQVTATVISGRKYTVTYRLKYTATVSADRFVVRIRSGSGTGGTELESVVWITPATLSSTLTQTIDIDWVASSTGSQTFTATVARVGGTGTLTVQGGTTGRRILKVDLVYTS